MSVDISPDRQWLVFDLLGQIYRLPIGGGEAVCLTQNSGIAVNVHPRFSPDGKSIAFVSDRSGASNLWVMDADGGHPQLVVPDSAAVAEPIWTADGKRLIVRRHDIREGTRISSSLWMYNRDGSGGTRIVSSAQGGTTYPVVWPWPAYPGAPSVSSDGRYLYYQAYGGGEAASGEADPLKGATEIRRLNLESGQVESVISGHYSQQAKTSSGGAIAPAISPDGRWLAFARRLPATTITFKGHEYGPRTALWLRDLTTGDERILMDPIELDAAMAVYVLRTLPGYSWASDSKSLVLSQGGKLRRVYVETGRVETIPFTAHVHRTISEMAAAPQSLPDGPMPIRAMRWMTGSPDGQAVAFQAIREIWIAPLAGTPPRRLLAQGMSGEQSWPSWSPDGQWVAFSNWDEKTRMGTVWKSSIAGGAPQRLAASRGQYAGLEWSRDGENILAVRGRDLVRIPSGGGDEVVLGTASTSRVSLTNDGRVVFVSGGGGRGGGGGGRGDGRGSTMSSVALSDGAARAEVSVPGATDLVLSPNGSTVAYRQGDDVIVARTFRSSGNATERVVDASTAKRVSPAGGYHPRWLSDSVLEFSNANHYYRFRVGGDVATLFPIALTVPRARAQGSIAITDVRVITLEARKVLEHATIVVRAGRIACVGQCATTGVEKVVRATGKTVIPGLIDVHFHSHAEGPQSLLAYGVTTLLNPSVGVATSLPLAESIEAGRTIGPRSFSAGTGLYGWQRELTSFELAETEIEKRTVWGVRTLKQYHQPLRQERQWVSEIARRRGYRVTAEGGGLEYGLGMAMDGQTGMEHPIGYLPIYSDVAKFFGQAGFHYSPTLGVGSPGPWNEEYFYQESEIWKDDKLRRWTPWHSLFPHAMRRTLRPKTDYSFPIIAQGVADIIREGGYGTIGSHGNQDGIGSQWEVWMMASALGPMGALETASLHGAHFLGLDNDLGSIRPGKLADLLVLNGNPLENIRATADIKFVMKSGTLYDATTLDEIWPQVRSYPGDYPGLRQVLPAGRLPIDFWDRRPRE